ncbi:MAG TPA: DNA repair protein RecO [Thermomicrobiales bacterium]|nr:DNA repair protein RecO [Thermomicrobiales bacterium]
MADSLRDRLYSTEVIVLSRRNLGEADRIYDVYSVRHGRMSMIAKGARKAENRNGRTLDLLNRVVVQLYRGRNLDVVRGVEPVATHPGLRSDLEAFGHASYIAELIRVMTHDHEPSAQIYTLLAETLALLADGVDPWPLTRYFEYALLEAAGFQAQLYECPRCREALTAQVNAFSMREGGVVCPRCRVDDPGSTPLSVNAQKYLRTMQREGLRRVLTLKLDSESRLQIQQALTGYMQHLAERPLGSLAVLHALQGRRDVVS